MKYGTFEGLKSILLRVHIVLNRFAGGGRWLDHILIQFRDDRRRQQLEKRYRQGAGEMIVLSFTPLDVRGSDAKVAIADVENESGGSIGGPRRGYVAPSIKGLNSVVTGTGFSPDRDQLPVGQPKNTSESPRGSALHHRGHRLSYRPSHFRDKNLLSWLRLPLEDSLVGRTACEMNVAQLRIGPPHAVVHQDPD